jgi:SsrA-binding protein
MLIRSLFDRIIEAAQFMIKKIINRKATFDYTIEDTYEAGIQLLGAEVKSIKGGRMSLEGSFVKIIGYDLFLVNAEIYPYPFARPEGYDSKRTRKLLLHKKQIISLISKMQSSNLTLIPLECYTTKGWIKVKIALAKGKKEYEKREKIRKRDIDRDIRREIRGKG